MRLQINLKCRNHLELFIRLFFFSFSEPFAVVVDDVIIIYYSEFIFKVYKLYRRRFKEGFNKKYISLKWKLLLLINKRAKL